MKPGRTGWPSVTLLENQMKFSRTLEFSVYSLLEIDHSGEQVAKVEVKELLVSESLSTLSC